MVTNPTSIHEDVDSTPSLGISCHTCGPKMQPPQKTEKQNPNNPLKINSFKGKKNDEKIYHAKLSTSIIRKLDKLITKNT